MCIIQDPDNGLIRARSTKFGYYESKFIERLQKFFNSENCFLHNLIKNWKNRVVVKMRIVLYLENFEIKKPASKVRAFSI